MTPGKQTSEFKLSLVTNLVTAVIALLIAYGVLSAEDAQLWQAVVMALIAVITPLAMALVTRQYTWGRTELKLEAMAPTSSQPGAAMAKPEASE
jgi:multisubunit Na+/H+ antiporter MnhB subunit